MFLYDGGIVPDPDGIITAGHDNKTARQISIRQGEPDQRAGADRDAPTDHRQQSRRRLAKDQGRRLSRPRRPGCVGRAGRGCVGRPGQRAGRAASGAPDSGQAGLRRAPLASEQAEAASGAQASGRASSLLRGRRLPVARLRRREPIVRLLDQRPDLVAIRRVARVEDRDPELLRVDGVGQEPVELGVVGLAFNRADEALEGLRPTPMFTRNTPARAVRLEGQPSSKSSVVTIVT